MFVSCAMYNYFFCEISTTVVGSLGLCMLCYSRFFFYIYSPLSIPTGNYRAHMYCCSPVQIRKQYVYIINTGGGGGGVAMFRSFACVPFWDSRPR